MVPALRIVASWLTAITRKTRIKRSMGCDYTARVAVVICALDHMRELTLIGCYFK